MIPDPKIPCTRPFVQSFGLLLGWLCQGIEGSRENLLTANKQLKSSTSEVIFHELNCGSKKNVRVADWKVDIKHIHVDSDNGSK